MSKLFQSLLCSIACSIAAVAASAPSFPPCCAYGGSGSAVALGAGVLDAFPPNSHGGPPTGPAYAAPMAVGVSPTNLFSTVLFAAASSPEDSRAGWIVKSNATNDMIFAFTNVTGTPICSSGVGPRGSYLKNYALCAGSGIFDEFDRDFLLTPSTRIGVFSQSTAAGSTMSFAQETCAPVALIGAESPLGAGAFAVNFESGFATEPPVSWSSPPSWCDGFWVEL